MVMELIDGKRERDKFYQEHPELENSLDAYLVQQYLNKIKYMEIADMKLSGMTLTEIGKTRGVTREAIRQILKRNFPDIKFPKNFKRVGLIEKICRHCGKHRILKDYIINRKKKYCSKKCWNDAKVAMSPLPVPVCKMNAEQLKVYNNKRTHDYYWKHRGEELSKARIRKANRRAYLKTLLEKGKITPDLYNTAYKRVNGDVLWK